MDENNFITLRERRILTIASPGILLKVGTDMTDAEINAHCVAEDVITLNDGEKSVFVLLKNVSAIIATPEQQEPYIPNPSTVAFEIKSL